MISVRIADRNDIARVMYDPDIWDRTTNGEKPENYDLSRAKMDGWTFLGGYVNNVVASLFIMRGDQLHYWVLKQYRKHARELLDASFAIWRRSVWCEIPSLYRAVINFALNYGFETEEIIKGAYVKNGKVYDMHILRYKWVR